MISNKSNIKLTNHPSTFNYCLQLQGDRMLLGVNSTPIMHLDLPLSTYHPVTFFGWQLWLKFIVPNFTKNLYTGVAN